MTARGIRNNNPGNIRRTHESWLGLSKEQTDDDFCQFESMAYGCRALLRVLRTYHERYGLCTVAGMIKRWAPENENNTKAYIEAVEKMTDLPAHKKFNFKKEPSLYVDVAKAIARVENGADDKLITHDDWREGAEMAGLKYD